MGILLFLQESVRNAHLSTFFQFLSEINVGGVSLWIVLSAFLLLFRKTRMSGVLILAALVCSMALGNVILKNAVQRTRPFVDNPNLQALVAAKGYSFPSGHAGGLGWNHDTDI